MLPPRVMVPPMRNRFIRLSWGHVLFYQIELGHYRPGVAVESFSGFGDKQLFGEPLKKQSLIMFLKLPDSLADRRLGYVEFFSSSAHFTCVCHCDKDFQMAYGHKISPSHNPDIIGITYEFYKIIFLFLYYCKCYNKDNRESVHKAEQKKRGE